MEKTLSSPEPLPQELTAEEQKKVDHLKETIDLKDPNAVIRYGSVVQHKISEFSDSILSEVRGKDTRHIGNMLGKLMGNVRDLDVDSLSSGKGFLSRIPFVGSWVDGARDFLTRYQTLSVQIMKVIAELERSKEMLLRDVEMLDQLYEKEIEYFQELNLYILAGEIKLTELLESLLPGMKEKAEASGDPIEAQRYRDAAQLAGRLEKKLHDLRLSRTIALQTCPQIRLVQHNNRELAEKIQSSILNTIPLWKNQMVVAISLLRQKQTLELQRAVSDTTRQLLEKNAEMLKDTAIGAAEEAERGIVDIETLKKVNADLISTIEETIKVHQAGKVRRKQAEEELVRMEAELREKILDLKSRAGEMQRGDES